MHDHQLITTCISTDPAVCIVVHKRGCPLQIALCGSLLWMLMKVMAFFLLQKCHPEHTIFGTKGWFAWLNIDPDQWLITAGCAVKRLSAQSCCQIDFQALRMYMEKVTSLWADDRSRSIMVRCYMVRWNAYKFTLCIAPADFQLRKLALSPMDWIEPNTCVEGPQFKWVKTTICKSDLCWPYGTNIAMIFMYRFLCGINICLFGQPVPAKQFPCLSVAAWAHLDQSVIAGEWLRKPQSMKLQVRILNIWNDPVLHSPGWSSGLSQSEV